MNFNCVFPSCDFKKNDIEEEEFLKHLNDVHHDEMAEVSERESIPIKMVEMISVSNSKVFINSGINFDTKKCRGFCVESQTRHEKRV